MNMTVVCNLCSAAQLLVLTNEISELSVHTENSVRITCDTLVITNMATLRNLSNFPSIQSYPILLEVM
jgi:archaellum biogenesis ATPase FlaH